MAVLRQQEASFQGPRHLEDCEVYTLGDCDLGIFSVVALHQDRLAGIPALGGTRWLVPKALEDSAALRSRAVEEAVSLAGAMQSKLNLLRRTAGKERPHLSFTGGKGVITGVKATELGPPEVERLQAHARLVVSMERNYLASKDQKVGTPELEIIEDEARRLDPNGRHTIGLGCLRDTGEATAWGVLAGIERAALEVGLATSLHGLPVLVTGLGKVGLPLVRMLVDHGADAYVFDPKFSPSSSAAEKWLGQLATAKAAVRPGDFRLLTSLAHRGRVLDPKDEHSALRDPRFSVVSPNGGNTNWMSDSLEGGARRFELLAAAGREGDLRLVVGAGNCQLPLTGDPASTAARQEALSALSGAGVCWIPDPVVSPGGVIAVSHERLPSWNARAVNAETRGIVKTGVANLFALARRKGSPDSLTLFSACQEMSSVEEKR